MKRVFSILVTAVLLLSICSCKTEKAEGNRYEPIFGCPAEETTNFVKAKYVGGDYYNLKFELEKNFWGEGIGEEFVAFIPVSYGIYHDNYPNEWFAKTCEPDFFTGETYLLCLKWEPYNGRRQVVGAWLCK